MMNEFDERYVTKMLQLHTEMNLDPADDSETRIWHMLRSLIEYCEAQHPRLDFDSLLRDVRSDFVIDWRKEEHRERSSGRNANADESPIDPPTVGVAHSIRREGIEDRDWSPTNPCLAYRGPVLIHASSKMEEWADWVLAEYGIELPPPDELPRGGIVGMVEIVDVVRRHASPWFTGRYGLVLVNPKPLPFRACSGKLGFFNV